MNYRIETRLALIVSLLAICTVAATAVAIRQGARSELAKASVFQTGAAQPVRPERLTAVALALAGHCCSPDAMGNTNAADLLEENEVALVYAPGSERSVARFNRLKDRLAKLDVARSSQGISVDATVQTDFSMRRVHLSISGPGVPLRLADQSSGSLYLFKVPLPEERARAASFLGALDRHVLKVAALVAAIAVLLTWIVARRVFNPLRELDRAVRAVADGNLERRVRVSGAGEVAQLEQRFNAMAQELGRQQQLRRDLAGDVAHELRAPLTGLRCRLEAMIDGVTACTAAGLASLQEDLTHLNRLVDDLQDLALAEAREIRLAPATLPVAPLVHSALRAAALEGDARIRLELAPGLDIHADEMRMRQVLVNLLTNADRYTRDDGSITVRSGAHNGDAVIEVHNSGSALDAAQLERVFSRFYRTDPARQRSTGGVGLGLAIVKSLVEAHGGRVWVKSDKEGVTFGCAIPRRPGTVTHGP